MRRVPMTAQGTPVQHDGRRIVGKIQREDRKAMHHRPTIGHEKKDTVSDDNVVLVKFRPNQRVLADWAQCESEHA